MTLSQNKEQKMSEIIIRNAKLDDAAILLEIYRPYVEKTAISFEYVVPSLEEFINRMNKVKQRYPYIVAEKDGEIVGYAYASTFHSRAAFDWCVETTVYVREGHRKSGIGKKLYRALEEALSKQNVLNLYACIAYTEKPDEHLNNNSVEFHEHFGYRLIGIFEKCGYKFGRWYDMVWMEKQIGEHKDNPLPVNSYQ